MDEVLKQEETPPNKCPKCGQLIKVREKSDANKLYDDLSNIFGSYLKLLTELHLKLKERLRKFEKSKFFPLLDSGYIKKQNLLGKVSIFFRLPLYSILDFLVRAYLVLVSFLIAFMEGFSIMIAYYNNDFFPWILPKLCKLEEYCSRKVVSYPSAKIC